MLKRHAAFFAVLQSVLDVLLVVATWLVTYFIRFYSGLFSYPKGIPTFGRHLYLTPLVAFLCYLGCSWAGLYRSKRLQTFRDQIVLALRTCVISGLLVSAALYYLYDEPYSRKLLAIFFVLLFAGLVASRMATMAVLRKLRRRGYNLRHYVVIGAGKKGQQLVYDMEACAWMGMKCAFFIDDNPARIGRSLLGVPVHGPLERAMEFMEGNDIDEVYLALGGSEAAAAGSLLGQLQCRGITVRIIPDWGHLSPINPTVVPVGSQFLFSPADTSLQSGSKIVLKETFDRLVAVVLLLLFTPPMLLIAILIKSTSKGPVFYKQTRVGLDHRVFTMVKFRTMKVGSEDQTGPVWTQPDDPRTTRIGAWLRRTSLDELPQLVNVIKGDMSLVGPRPERPAFVEQFSHQYGKYELRHKVKAGMTGWAQIHGFRGNCSLRKRLQYDLYYIRNWSFSLDIQILLVTVWQTVRVLFASPAPTRNKG